MTRPQFDVLRWYAAGMHGPSAGSQSAHDALEERGYIEATYRVTVKGRNALHRNRYWRELLDRVQR